MPHGNGILKDIEITEDHLHPPGGEVWIPADITTTFSLITGALANAFGAWVQLMAATSATQRTDNHRILIVSASADATYEVQIGTGPSPSEVEITKCRFHWFSAVPVRAPPGPVEIMCPRIPLSTRLVARVKCSAAGPNTVTAQYGYHEYPEGV